MSGVATAIGVVGVIGAGVAYNSAENAEDAQHAAAQQANQTTGGALGVQRNDQAPWRNTGMGALQQMAAYYGIPWNTNPNYDGNPANPANAPLAMPDAQTYARFRADAFQGNHFDALDQGRLDRMVMDWRAQQPNPVGPTTPRNPGLVAQGGQPGQPGQPGAPNALMNYQASPDYQFRFNEGQRMVESSAASRGRFFSPSTQLALQQHGQGLASQEFGNTWNRLAALAGIGQTATNQLGQAGQNAANNNSRNQLAAGDATASSYLAQGAAVNGALNNALYGWGRYGGGGGGGGLGGGYGSGGGLGGGGYGSGGYGGAFTDPNWQPNFSSP